MSADELSLLDAIYTQRAIRSFRNDPIPDEVITRLIEAATKAPSAANAQPWAFIVVRDTDLLKQIAGYARAGFKRMYDRAMARRQDGDPLPFKRLAPMIEAFDQIPVLVVACLVDAPGQAGSIYPAIQNLLLTARSLNIGAALTTGWALPYTSDIKALLDLPDSVEPVAFIPLGYPDKERYGPTTRRPVQEVLHWDRWTAGKENSAVTSHR